MKRLAVVAVVLVACSPEVPDSTESVVSQLTGPVAAFGFDEGGGATTTDSTSNRLVGTLSNATWTAGKYGGALSFNGTNARVNVPHNAVLNLTTAMTLEAWVKPTTQPDWSTIVMKERSGALSYVLYGDALTPVGDFTTGSTYHSLYGTSTFPTGSWTHLAVTYDQSTLRLYKNGVAAGTLASTDSITTSTNPLSIGGNNVWGEWFNGAIDEVRIYDRALSAAEIVNDMNTPIGGSADASAGGQDAAGGADGPADVRSEPDAAVVDVRSEPDAAEAGADVVAETGSDVGSGDASGGFDAANDVREAAVDSGAPDAGGGGVDAGSGGSGSYPLRKLAGARYLVDRSGLPFLLHGDAAWSLIAQLTTEDAIVYLDDRTSRGFNSVIVNLIEHQFASKAPADIYGHQPFTTPGNFTTPNDAYFARAELVVQAAAARGIELFLFPAYLGAGGGQQGWYQEMAGNGTANLFTYGQYVGRRFGVYDNIVWVMGGDYNPPNKALVEAVANGIRSVDTRHLMTSHGDQNSSLAFWAGEPWLDFDSVYTYQSVAGAMLVEYQRTNWLPAFLIESAYENENSSTRSSLREQAYEAILNGGMGQFFGNGPIWCFSANCFVSGDWHTQLGSRGAQDQQVLKGFFAPRHWEKLVPDTAHTFITAGFSGASAERASDGSWGVIFVPTSRSVTVNLASLTGGPKRARWFSPSSGVYTDVSGSPFANSGTVTTSPPGSGDWLLVLE
jgi:Protein of unknown function (DUF4038)/Concanavalin A-like lectin/glucanases superfamily/Putative collagen-binding domain of a collagenase